MSFAALLSFAETGQRILNLAANHATGEESRSEKVSGMKAQELEPVSVLIADDDGTCRETLREIVEPQGYRTRLASSGEEALDIVREEPIHLALLDMHMPTLTGLETLRLVRQINAWLPCVLVTADASDALLRQAIQAHAFSVIHKPVSKSVVLYTVLRALARFHRLLKGDTPSE